MTSPVPVLGRGPSRQWFSSRTCAMHLCIRLNYHSSIRIVAGVHCNVNDRVPRILSILLPRHLDSQRRNESHSGLRAWPSCKRCISGIKSTSVPCLSWADAPERAFRWVKLNASPLGQLASRRDVCTHARGHDSLFIAL